MVKTIDMQDLRYLNLFTQITQVRTSFCFKYNNVIFFCVPKNLVSKAVGKEAKNIRKIGMLLRKRVKVIFYPEGISDLKKFIEKIVSPVTFSELEVKHDQVILTAGKQSKAALIGRNRRRSLEMEKIIADYFGKEFRIA